MNNTSQTAATLAALTILQIARLSLMRSGDEAWRIVEAAINHVIGFRNSTVDPNLFDMLLDGEDK